MKIKKFLILVIGILLGSLSVYALSIKSNSVTYTPEDDKWKVINVEDALNDLNVFKNNYLSDGVYNNLSSLLIKSNLPITSKIDNSTVKTIIKNDDARDYLFEFR